MSSGQDGAGPHDFRDLQCGIRHDSDSGSHFAYPGMVFKFPESATVIVLLMFAAALAACTPSQDDAMRSPSPTAAQL